MTTPCEDRASRAEKNLGLAASEQVGRIPAGIKIELDRLRQFLSTTVLLQLVEMLSGITPLRRVAAHE